jgi:hypothetical protein
MNQRGKLITKIPKNMIERPVLPIDEYYPAGVDDTTKVEVVLWHKNSNILILCQGQARCFGWTKRPTMSYLSGIEFPEIPLTHYRIL